MSLFTDIQEQMTAEEVCDTSYTTVKATQFRVTRMDNIIEISKLDDGEFVNSTSNLGDNAAYAVKITTFDNALKGQNDIRCTIYGKFNVGLRGDSVILQPKRQEKKE